MSFAGLYTPIVTPFQADGDLDEAAVRFNVDRYLETALTGVIVLGSNGEAAQLDEAESDRAIAIVRDAVPRGRRLLAGTGRESTRATIEATRRAAALGVDAVMVRTPSFYKNQMTSDVFIRHYRDVADASPVPILLYNVTMYTGVNLTPDAVAALSEHPNIVGMKESGNDMVQLADTLARVTSGFVVLAGSASTCYASLALGAHGAVLALAGVVPELCLELVDLAGSGRHADARALQQRLMPVARAVGATYGVPGLKAALHLMGYRAGLPRPPLRPVSPDVVDRIRGELTALGVFAGSPAM